MKTTLKSLFLKAAPLAVVIFISAGFRIALTIEHSQHPIFESLRIDENEYKIWAHEVSKGKLFMDFVPNHGPGYPWALGMVCAIFGYGFLVPRIFNICLGVASVVLVHKISSRLFGPREALVSALMFGLYWPFLIFEQKILAVTLFLFLNLAGLLAGLRAIQKGSVMSWACCGLLFGLAAIIRPTIVPIIVVFCIWALLRESGNRKFGKVLALLGASILLIVPVVIKNHTISGEWVLVQENTGMNLYLGNNPDSDGHPYARPGGVWDKIKGMPKKEAGLDRASEKNQYYTGLIIQFMSQKPGPFAALQLKKTALLLNHRELRATLDPGFFRSLFESASLPLPGFALVLGLALPGLLALRRSRKDHQFLLIFAAIHAVLIVVTLVSSRYRAPFTAALLILSGPGLLNIASSLKLMAEKRINGLRLFQPRSSAALVLAVSGVMFALVPIAPDYTMAEEWEYLGYAWQKAGDRYQASQCFHKALSLDPSHAMSMVAMGDLTLSNGDLYEAQKWYKRAIAADEGNGTAYYHLGISQWKAGNKEAALESISTSLSLKPENISILFDLASIKIKMGMFDQAKNHLRQILTIRPHEQKAKEMLYNLDRLKNSSLDN